MEILDINDFLERVAEDQDLLLELLDDFENDFIKNRDMLEDAIELKDYEQIKNIAHRIKGASGNISVSAMYNCCMLIEQMAVNTEIDLIKELFTDLNNQFAELQDYIVKLKRTEK